MSQKKIIFVLGMHRSGTSALTKALEVFGVDLGNDLMPGLPTSNVKGHFEDNEIAKFNIRLLSELEIDWHYPKIIEGVELVSRLAAHINDAKQLLSKKLGSKITYGIKDPRISLLLPFWLKVIEGSNITPYFLIAFRNPLAVAQSIYRRDKIPYQKSFWLWFIYNLMSLKNTEGHSRYICQYTKHLSNPSVELLKIGKFLGLPVDGDKLKEHIDEFLESSLNHETPQTQIEIPQLIESFYNELRTQIDINSVLTMFPLNKWFIELNQIRGILDLISIYDRQVDTLRTGKRALTSIYFFDEVKLLLGTVSKEFEINESIQEIHFKLQEATFIHSFGWDPIEDGPCIVETEKVELITLNNERICLNPLPNWHNGNVDGKSIIFYTFDPRQEYIYDGLVNEIRITALVRRIYPIEVEKYKNSQLSEIQLLLNENLSNINNYKEKSEQQITTLNELTAELSASVNYSLKQIDFLKNQIEKADASLSYSNLQVESLSNQLAEKEKMILEYVRITNEQITQLNNLEASLSYSNLQVESLSNQLSEKEKMILEYVRITNEQITQLNNLEASLSYSNLQVESLNNQLAEKEKMILEYVRISNEQMNQLLNSWSWKITSPLRHITKKFR